MELWIIFTLAAAFLQNARSVLQKQLKGQLSTAGAAFSRFVYALPLALPTLPLFATLTGEPVPAVHWPFLIFCALGGLSQILFTVVLLWMFSFRSFAVGTTFSKLEVVMIAGLGAALLGDKISPFGIVAIALGAMGALALAFSEAELTIGGLWRGLIEKATAVGLLSAVLLGASVVFFRGATTSLEGASVGMAAMTALTVGLTMQTIMMGAWFFAFDREEGQRVLKKWRVASPAGAVGWLCSVCWFTAFTLQNAAYVRAVGQVELIFTFLAGVFVFKERTTRIEAIGIALVAISILSLLLLR